VRSDKSIEFDREAGFALQILQGSDYLRSIALSNRESLYAAITNVAAIGVSLNPAEKLAYLVPRKKAVCLDISYMGLLDIAQSAGAIRWGQAWWCARRTSSSCRASTRSRSTPTSRSASAETSSACTSW
jgi:recombination protein RecT